MSSPIPNHGRIGRTNVPPSAPSATNNSVFNLEGVPWVITVGESAGPPDRALVEITAQGLHPKAECLRWAPQIRDLWRAGGVAFFHK